MTKLTEVFRIREAEGELPRWAKDDERARRERQGAPSAPTPSAAKGTKGPEPAKPSAGAPAPSRGRKPGLDQARGKYLWVNQAAPTEMSPYAIQKNRIGYDQLPGEPFEQGYARVDSNPEPAHGWGAFKIAPDGGLSLHKDSWDSSG